MSMELVSHTTFEQSETIGKLAEALASAQGEITNASADTANPFFHSKYADLATITDVCREPLSKYKIARHQAVMTGPDGSAGVRTTLIHASGEWLSSTAWCKPEKGGAQALGSVITYLRRYSLAAAVGIAQEDDDAESAENRPSAAKSPPARKAEPAPRAAASAKSPPAAAPASAGSASLQVDIRKLVGELNWDAKETVAFFEAKVGKTRFAEMSEAEMGKLKAELQAVAEARAKSEAA